MYDVVVVGGGPAGSQAAKEAARYGLRVLLIERKKYVGRPVHCTGLLSTRTIETLKISMDSILNEIKGAHIYSPNGKRVTIDAEEVKAYVVNRETFDNELLQRAREEGVEVWLETEGIAVDGRMVKVDCKGVEKWIKAEIFVGAYGSKNHGNSLMDFPLPYKNLCGLQIVVSYEAKDRSFVELFFGNRYTDCFFGWAVPLDEKLAKVGLVASNFAIAKNGLKELLKYIRCTSSRSPVPGIIPIGPPKITVKDNLIICGDAAGHAKPTSGGGVYTGTICATIAAGTIVEYLSGSSSLKEYDRSWRSKIGRELKMGLAVHHILTRLNDNQLNRIFDIFSKQKNIELIKKYGDIDYPSSLIKKFISVPFIWKNILPSSPDFLSLKKDNFY